jgi:retron-type reverse transcriptase
MGFLDWLKDLLFGGLPERRTPPPPPKAPPPPAPPPGRPRPSPAPFPTLPPAHLPSYDAGDFAPIRPDEVKAKLSKENFWQGFRMRTDVIPPVSDEWVRILDRALVTRGLLTPDELAEIHAVGDQWLHYRGDEMMLRERARAAVEEVGKQRAELKARKKREAEERRRKRAEASAQRRRLDIDFLGRGVSGGLARRTSDQAKLTPAGLPFLETPGDVARAMGLPVPQLRWLAFHSDAATKTHYVTFTVPKKSGGLRELASPHKHMAAAQRWIFANVISRLKLEEPAHGFVKGRSTVTNARPHVGTKVLVNLDLKDFFPTITFPRVRGLFESMGYSGAVATIFALLCTEAPRRRVEYDGRPLFVAIGPRALPQGACTSPAISNLVSRTLDRRLAATASKLAWRYTRYADDLSFSCDREDAAAKPANPGWLMARVRHILEEEGFSLNPKKARVQRPNAAQVVTGIVVNRKLSVPRAERRRLRAALHRAKKSGAPLDAVIAGHLAYVRMVNADQHARLVKSK